MKKESTLNREVVKNSNRTFYLNVKQSEKGNNYLVITQAQTDKEGNMERQSIVLFEAEVASFAAAMTRSILMFNPSEESKLKEANYKKKKAAIIKEYPNAFKKWSSAEETLLKEFFAKGATIEELTVTLQRNEAGVLARLNKLGLMTEKELENIVSEGK